MHDIAIDCHDLSKRYRLGDGEPYRALRDTIARAWRRGDREAAQDARHIWAVRDLSVQIRTGEIVGIIGRNGAGKSTFLRILSRITEPTSGYADIHGAIGSLLEVGTGFHPELTGRDNIFLNGSILGMPMAQIRRRFDEIVAFSEIERFIDTPVKKYSSGMYVRLAFAVAAHLDTEILLVDEVLAVGDAAFQRKCLGKIQDVCSTGRTVLFVSHSMAAVASLCTRALYMSAGRVLIDSDVPTAIGAYLNDTMPSSVAFESRTPNVEIARIAMKAAGPGRYLVPLAPTTLAIDFVARRAIPDLSFRIAIDSADGTRLMAIDSWVSATGARCNAGDAGSLAVEFDALPLNPGRYRLRVWAHSFLTDIWDEVPDVYPIEVYEAVTPLYREFEPHTHGPLAARVTVTTTAAAGVPLS